MNTFFRITVIARAVVTMVRRRTKQRYWILEQPCEDPFTAPRKEFSTGPPVGYVVLKSLILHPVIGMQP